MREEERKQRPRKEGKKHKKRRHKKLDEDDIDLLQDNVHLSVLIA